MNSHRIKKHVRQEGILLIEVLMAIVIFSLGVLALIALQASSVKQSTDAKYRSDAIILADELIGKMWVGNRTATALQTNFGSSGTEYIAWLGNSSAPAPGTVLATLPGASNHHPDVTVTATAGGAAGIPATSTVYITLYWKAPYEKSSEPEHQYTVTTQISPP